MTRHGENSRTTGNGRDPECPGENAANLNNSELDTVPPEHLQVLRPKPGTKIRNGLVVVIEIITRSPPVERGTDQRHGIPDIRTADGGDLRHGMEQGVGIGGNVGIGGGRLGDPGECGTVIGRKPGERSDPQLISRSGGRSVEKTLPLVVEQILAVVGAIEHGGRHAAERTEVSDGLGEEVVGITNGIVVGVAQLTGILGRDGDVAVGQEPRELAGITLMITEMRPVAMEDEEQPRRRTPADGFLHLFEQLHVVARRTDIDQMPGVVDQAVDHGPLPRLVGNEPGIEPGLVEERGEPLDRKSVV